jgi:hypothetical protein
LRDRDAGEHGKVRQIKPSAKGKWDVLVSSTLSTVDRLVDWRVGEEANIYAGSEAARRCGRCALLNGELGK